MALLSFNGSPHGGVHKLLPEWSSQPRITPKTIIDHSIVGSALGAFFFFRDHTGIESHFIVDLNGEIWQLMDTGRQADANLEANSYAISIETADNGNPNTFPWTNAQLDSLTWLHDKLRAIHPTIPRKKATSCTSGGLGFHSQMGAPSCWTPAVGKTCPGKPARVEQWNNILVPRFLQAEEDDLPYTESELRTIIQSELEQFRARRPENMSNDPNNKPLTMGESHGAWAGGIPKIQATVADHTVALTAITEQLATIEAKVDGLSS